MNVVMMLAALAASVPVRDPFWPVGYEGERRVISPELRVDSRAMAETPRPESISAKPEAPRQDVLDSIAAAESARLSKEMSGRWEAALKTLRFGGTVHAKSEGESSGRMVMLINGWARSEGDLVRTDHDGYRFVWRIEKSDVERKLRLSRVRTMRLDASKGKNKE